MKMRLFFYIAAAVIAATSVCYSSECDYSRKHDCRNHDVNREQLQITTGNPSRTTKGESSIYGDNISSHHEESSKLMVVRDKKICKKLGLKAIKVSEANNPYDPSGKLYRCASDIDFPIVHILPPFSGSNSQGKNPPNYQPEDPPNYQPENPPNYQPEDPPNYQPENPPDYQLCGRDDPLYPKMNLRDENPHDLDIRTILSVRGFLNDYATDHSPKDIEVYAATWDTDSYYPNSGITMSINIVSSIKQWTTDVLRAILSTSDDLSPINRITPEVDYNLHGNFCYVEAARLNKAEQEFESYGFFCGTGSCPGTEECDFRLIKQTCVTCSKDGKCSAYDCSYCEGPVGDCSGCLEKEKEYIEALKGWQECTKKAENFLTLVCKTAHTAYDWMVRILSGEKSTSSPDKPSFKKQRTP
ncbi:MAG: hypothetical protein QXO76_00190 [Thermoproteota archaeon]